MFALATASIKATHHHYCGFYSDMVLPSFNGSTVSVNNKYYTVSNDLVIDWAYDGQDTIVTFKRAMYTEDCIPLGSLITQNGKILGAIVRRSYKATEERTWDGGQHCTFIKTRAYYPIQDGFRFINVHLTGCDLQLVEKTKPIAYANRQFDTKEQLVSYLASPSRDSGAIMYHTNGQNAQMIVYVNGLNIINQHFRAPIVNIAVPGQL